MQYVDICQCTVRYVVTYQGEDLIIEMKDNGLYDSMLRKYEFKKLE